MLNSTTLIKGRKEFYSGIKLTAAYQLFEESRNTKGFRCKRIVSKPRALACLLDEPGRGKETIGQL